MIRKMTNREKKRFMSTQILRTDPTPLLLQRALQKEYVVYPDSTSAVDDEIQFYDIGSFTLPQEKRCLHGHPVSAT
jgi:hypothetical protein